MTWIIGRSGPFGHAIGISDIRVTLPDGIEIDCLQKIYRIAGNMAIGFSGSVAIGLEVIAQLSTALNIQEKNKIYDPFYIAKYFHIGTRKIYEKYVGVLPKPTTNFLLFSAHPTMNDGVALWAKCFVHRFCSPNFEPEEINQGEIVSIGSGSHIEQYKEALEKLEKDTEMFQLEMGMPGGSGLGLMMSITETLKTFPKRSISQYLQTVLVGRNNVRISNNFPFVKDGSDQKSETPRLAQNLDELNQILYKRGMSAVQKATC